MPVGLESSLFARESCKGRVFDLSSSVATIARHSLSELKGQIGELCAHVKIELDRLIECWEELEDATATTDGASQLKSEETTGLTTVGQMCGRRQLARRRLFGII